MREGGFVLIVSLIVAVLMSGLVGLAFLTVIQKWKLAADVESHLHSQVLAENGVEYARHLLPSLEISELLNGSDGVFCSAQISEWRNPMTLESAQRVDLSEWAPECDDGLLSPPAGLFENPETHFFLIRVSNNPEEQPFQDFDKTVVVRSMGIVPQRVSTFFDPDVKNCVTIIETRLRQEMLFQLLSPLVIFGDAGDFTFEGNQFLLDGGSHSAITVVGAMTDLLSSIADEQRPLILGGGEQGSITDGTEQYSSDFYSRLFKSSFWHHFLTHLPGYADPFPPTKDGPGLYFLHEGGLLQESYFGMLVARGDLVLSGNAKFAGLLLHLGNGRLTITDEAEVTGAVWASNLDHSTDPLKCLQISVELSGSCQIIYDPLAVRNALKVLPATQLGWRMIFPEMEQG